MEKTEYESFLANRLPDTYGSLPRPHPIPNLIVGPLGSNFISFIDIYQLNHYISDTNEQKTRIPKTQEQDPQISLTSLQSLSPYIRSLSLMNFQDLDNHFFSISSHGLFINRPSSTLLCILMTFTNTIKTVKPIPQTKTGNLAIAHLGVCPIAT